MQRRAKKMGSVAGLAALVLTSTGCVLDWSSPATPITGSGGGTGGIVAGGGAGGLSADGGGGATGGGGEGGAGGASPCPIDEPAEGTVCASADAVCQYGTGMFDACRRRVQCSDSAWEELVPGSSEANCATICPELTHQGGPCRTVGDLCTFADGKQCKCPEEKILVCAFASQGEPCPAPFFPNEGVACTNPGLFCSYGSCEFSTRVARECTKSTPFGETEVPVWINKQNDCE